MKKLKKSFSILLAFCTALSFFTLGGCGKKLGQLQYEAGEDGITVRSYKDVTAVTSLEIPDEIEGLPVTKVADYAVCNSESLTKISIGKNVSEIGAWAFTNNSALEEFIVDPQNERFCAEDGVLLTKDKKTLLFFPMGKRPENDSYAVPGTVETVRSKAFYRCGFLKNIDLPSGLVNIDERAFHKCSSLERLVLPNGLSFIGKDAFFGCTSLTSITIPVSVTRIDEYAFYNCTGLLSVTVLAKEENMELGKKWYPTNNGRELDKLEIRWEQARTDSK